MLRVHRSLIIFVSLVLFTSARRYYGLTACWKFALSDCFIVRTFLLFSSYLQNLTTTCGFLGMERYRDRVTGWEPGGANTAALKWSFNS